MRKPHLEAVEGAFVADDATVVGDVKLSEGVSVWYGTVIRGDVAPIAIGKNTNIQDLSVIHPQHDENVTIGAEVTVGHAAIVHCRTVEDRCLIGIKAILLPGSVIGEGSIIAAGALVPQGIIIPPRSLVVGVPGKVVRSVSDEEYAALIDSATRYLDYTKEHVLE